MDGLTKQIKFIYKVYFFKFFNNKKYIVKKFVNSDSKFEKLNQSNIIDLNNYNEENIFKGKEKNNIQKIKNKQIKKKYKYKYVFDYYEKQKLVNIIKRKYNYYEKQKLVNIIKRKYNYYERNFFSGNKNSDDDPDSKLKELNIIGWNGCGVNMKPGKVKTELLTKSTVDIILLLEQWTLGYMKDYNLEFNRDDGTKTGKINSSIFVRKEQKYNRFGININNAILIEIPEAKMILGVCYARPGKNSSGTKEINEIMFTEIKSAIEFAIMNKDNWGILIFGDFNRQENLWENIYSKVNQKLVEIGEGTHINRKNKEDGKADLQKIYTSNAKIEVKVLEQTLEKVSDHAMIHITCTQKMIEEGDGSKRSTIPNKKTAERIHNLIRNGANWDKIYQDILSNDALLKMKIKNKKNKIDLEQWKQIQEKLATDESVKSIEKSNYEGFKKHIFEIGIGIGNGKSSSDAWKCFKALTKYHLIGKKEGQILQKVKNKNNEIVSGAKMYEVLIEYIKEQHTASDPNDKMEIQKWDFDMEITTKKAKEISYEISKGKALSWDCIRDQTFKLCKECYKKEDDKECNGCKFVIQRIKDVFKNKFWERTGAEKHFMSRLIPLDKAAPKVVEPENAFRPICVSSTIIRLQEGALINKLRSYVKNKVHYSQCGFIGGRSCAHNLVRLHMLRENKKKELFQQQIGVVLTIGH